MECQPRCPMDTLMLSMDTMDTTMAGQEDTTRTQLIIQSMGQLTKDNSTSDEELPEPKTWVKIFL